MPSGSFRILWPLKSATHFEVDCVLRIAYCVLAAPYAVHFEVVCVLRITYLRIGTLRPFAYCVLRITYYVLAAHFEVVSVLRILRITLLYVLAGRYAVLFEEVSVLRIAYCVLPVRFEVVNVLRITYYVLAL